MKHITAILILVAALFGCDGDIDKLYGTVSGDLPDECVQNLMEADAWLIKELDIDNNVDFLMHYTVNADVTWQKPKYREVIFSKYLGEENLYTTNDRFNYDVLLDGGRIQLQNCEVQTIANELAHLYGLESVNEPGRLMHHVYGPENVALTPLEKHTLRYNILANK